MGDPLLNYRIVLVPDRKGMWAGAWDRYDCSRQDKTVNGALLVFPEVSGANGGANWPPRQERALI